MKSCGKYIASRQVGDHWCCVCFFSSPWSQCKMMLALYLGWLSAQLIFVNSRNSQKIRLPSGWTPVEVDCLFVCLFEVKYWPLQTRMISLVDSNPVIQVPVFWFHREIHTPAIKQRWHFSQMFGHHLFLYCQTWFERSVSCQDHDRFNSFIWVTPSVISMNEHHDLESQHGLGSSFIRDYSGMGEDSQLLWGNLFVSFMVAFILTF